MTIEEAVTSLILADPSRLRPEPGGAIEVLDVVVHPVIARRGDREHRPISVRLTAAGEAGRVELWLKSRPGLAALFPLLETYSRRLDDRVFPRPLYAWTSPAGEQSFIVTERIDGEPLRNQLVKAAALRQAARLGPVFRSNGAKMRSFHDASEPSGSADARSLVDDTRSRVIASELLTAAEKTSIAGHLDRHAAAIVAARTLPLRKIHHDWILRNIVVDRDGRDLVVDCDSMRAADDLRWYDVAYLLINLESQIKWSPVVTRRSVAPLWREFWSGYRGGDATVDGLADDQIAALLYLLRVRYLVGATLRIPLPEMFSGIWGRRYVRALMARLCSGKPSLFDDVVARG